jgi:hypothetical protein
MLATIFIVLALCGTAYAAQQTILSGSGVYWSDEKDKINDNFDELYADDAALGTASTRDAEDTMTDGANLPDGAAIKAYGDSNWVETETNSLETTVTGIADTEIFVGDGADSGTFVVLSGDATLDNTGAITIADDVIDADSMADADHGDVSWTSGVATVEAVSGANAVDSDAYVDGSIDTAHIAADQITEALIADDAIEESHLKAVDAAADEECLTYESTTGDFEWQSCDSGAGDVTAAGDNTFTGTNTHSGTETFTGTVNLPSSITLPDNSVDSDQYVDGSIGAAHIASYTLSPIVIAEPDVVQTIADAWPLYQFLAESYPSGVTITSIHVKTSAACTDTLNFEEWAQQGTSATSTVEAITLSGTYTEDGGTLADADIAADGWLYVDLVDAGAGCDVGWMSITISFVSQ